MLSIGATLEKICKQDLPFASNFSLNESDSGGVSVDYLHYQARSGQCFKLYFRNGGGVSLVGNGVVTSEGSFFNFGFGLSLARAVVEFNLAISDFSKSDPTVDFLFLIEANKSLLNAMDDFRKELAHAHMDAEHLALRDPLTGLLNRRGMLDAINVISSRSDGHDISVVCLDVDNFKNINDSFGHAVGDVVLQKIATILKRQSGSGDIVSRCGGDEFSVVVIGGGSSEYVKAYWERCLHEMNNEFRFIDNDINITVSMGFSFSGDFQHACIDSLFKKADLAMYVDKLNRGR